MNDRQGQLIARLLDMLEADLHPDISHTLDLTIREYKPEVSHALGDVILASGGVPPWASRIPGTPFSDPHRPPLDEVRRYIDDSVHLSNKSCREAYYRAGCGCPPDRCWYSEQKRRREDGAEAISVEHWRAELGS